MTEMRNDLREVKQTCVEYNESSKEVKSVHPLNRMATNY